MDLNFIKSVFASVEIILWLVKRFIHSFIYFWLCWVFIAAYGLSPVNWEGGSALHCGAGLFTAVAAFVAQALGCAGFTVCCSQALEHRLCGCSTWRVFQDQGMLLYSWKECLFSCFQMECSICLSTASVCLMCHSKSLFPYWFSLWCLVSCYC